MKTGKVVEFVDEEIEALQEAIAKKLGYRLVDHRLELYGVPIEEAPGHLAAGMGEALSRACPLLRARPADHNLPPDDRITRRCPARAKKRLYIKTYGCQMNVYDSERMADVLRPLGYGLTDDAEGADLVVLNTCHIREKATEKVYSELGRLKR